MIYLIRRVTSNFNFYWSHNLFWNIWISGRGLAHHRGRECPPVPRKIRARAGVNHTRLASSVEAKLNYEMNTNEDNDVTTTEVWELQGSVVVGGFWITNISSVAGNVKLAPPLHWKYVGIVEIVAPQFHIFLDDSASGLTN